MALGSGCLLLAAPEWHVTNSPKFISYLVLAALSSPMKVKLPGIDGTL